MDGETTVALVLERAADLIEPEGAWTQGVWGYDTNGEEQDADYTHFVSRCAECAIRQAVSPSLTGEARWELIREASRWLLIGAGVVPSADPGHWSPQVTKWNDAKGRTQEQVVTALRAAAQAERGAVPA